MHYLQSSCICGTTKRGRNRCNFYFPRLYSSTAAVYSFVRRVLTASSIGLAASGHAPVCYHVSSCDTDGNLECSELSVSEQSCCSRRLCADESSSDSSEPPGDDSGSCALCQSLAVTCGVPVMTQPFFPTVFISITHPRGPPGFVYLAAVYHPPSLCLDGGASVERLPDDACLIRVQTLFHHLFDS